MLSDSASMNKKQVSRLHSTDRIQRAARALFVRKGYANTTVEEIADLCGLTKGAVYHYFDNKENLLLSIIKEIEREVVDQTIDFVRHQNGSATDRLVSFLHTQAKYAAEKPDDFLLLVLMSIEFSNAAPKIGKRLNNVYDKLYKAAKDIFESGRRSGEFSSSISDRDLALFFMAAYDGNVLQWYRSDRKPEVGRALVRALRTTILRSVGIVDDETA